MEALQAGKIYYVYLDGEKKGPFSKQNLQIMHRAGKIEDSTQVWTNELGDWVSLSDLVKLRIKMICSSAGNKKLEKPLHSNTITFPKFLVLGIVSLFLVITSLVFVYQHFEKKGKLPDFISSELVDLQKKKLKKSAFVVCGVSAVTANGEKREFPVNSGSDF